MVIPPIYARLRGLSGEKTGVNHPLKHPAVARVRSPREKSIQVFVTAAALAESPSRFSKQNRDQDS